MTSTPILDTTAVLDGVRADRRDADAAEARILQRALVWAQMHPVAAGGTAATYGDTPVALGSVGTPLVSHFAVVEFGAASGLSRRSTEVLFGEVLDLAYRLPLTWVRVTTGNLKGWKARQIAAGTNALSVEAAAYVDAQVAKFASRVSAAELQRLVDSAIARFMPAHAEKIAAQAEDRAFFEIDYDQPSYTGTCSVRGEVDLPDALDLEQAIRAGAEQQKTLGSQLPLNARRAKTLGNLARGEYEFDYNSGLPEAEPGAADVKPATVAARTVMIYTHLSHDALTRTADVTGGTGWIENAGTQLVTAEQVRDWCRTAGKVIIRPVIDLNEEITTPGYRPSARLEEHIVLRDRICVFPYCERNARSGDKDHIDEFDKNGPPDQTTSSNLAALCRFHHRLKTHSGWTYTMIEPGKYLWRSPHGYTFLTDRHGTQDLTPRPLDPPGS